jgi:ATP-binding cassette, subfamily B, multidrug efflux pump
MSQNRTMPAQRGGNPGPMMFGGRGGFGMPTQKANNFRGTLWRLIGYFRPQKYQLIAVLAAAILSTVFNIIGPKILGLAITKLFEGFVLKMRHVPGASIDFAYIDRILLILA